MKIMEVKQLVNELLEFKKRNTKQSWIKNTVFYSNEYIDLISIETSNKHGGNTIYCGKQWSLIINVKKHFVTKDTWLNLKKCLGKDLDFTPVNKGKYKGKYGIRFYRMSDNPNNKVITDILDYLFS